MSQSDIESGRIEATRRKRMSGFSMIELIVVCVVIGILSAISIPYLYNFKKLYKSEDQAISVMDLMRETAQLALNRRRTMRLEIDQNMANPVVRQIDENGALPDILIKTIPLEPMREVRMDIIPVGVTIPNPPNYANAAFTAGVWTARFRSDGSVVNAANIPISATIYSWPPRAVAYNPSDLTPRQLTEVRAITIFGGSGAVRYWRHNGTTFLASQ